MRGSPSGLWFAHAVRPQASSLVGFSAMGTTANRRRHDRFILPHLYTRIEAGPARGAEKYPWEGHAYDLSEGGAQFELDHLLTPGSPVRLRIELPGAGLSSLQIASGAAAPIVVHANVVWIEDEDEPAPFRMAAVFSRFAHEGDRQRLIERLRSGRFALRAA